MSGSPINIKWRDDWSVQLMFDRHFIQKQPFTSWLPVVFQTSGFNMPKSNEADFCVSWWANDYHGLFFMSWFRARLFFFFKFHIINILVRNFTPLYLVISKLCVVLWKYFLHIWTLILVQIAYKVRWDVLSSLFTHFSYEISIRKQQTTLLHPFID